VTKADWTDYKRAAVSDYFDPYNKKHVDYYKEMAPSKFQDIPEEMMKEAKKQGIKLYYDFGCIDCMKQKIVDAFLCDTKKPVKKRGR
jgi:hypothetical protein